MIGILKREILGQAVVITLGVPSLDIQNASRIQRIVADEIPREGSAIIDLGELRYFDVTGFAAILSWVAESPSKAEVRLCSGSGAIRALFELLQGDKLVPLYVSVEEAAISLPGAERIGADLQTTFVPGQIAWIR
ncbi:MAG TPA: STAS domain-containing protein [Bryobacteraceae bacterium]|jgi:anti-anti-sigma factor|nr:STAS domain-containing protein [Bryobacteraceae bacterium]